MLERFVFRSAVLCAVVISLIASLFLYRLSAHRIAALLFTFCSYCFVSRKLQTACVVIMDFERRRRLHQKAQAVKASIVATTRRPLLLQLKTLEQKVAELKLLQIKALEQKLAELKQRMVEAREADTFVSGSADHPLVGATDTNVYTGVRDEVISEPSD